MILSCPTAFKGTIGAPAAAHALAEGARRAFPARRGGERPLAAGGTGWLDALGAARGGAIREGSVTGPVGARVPA
ncbi:MAG: glycerate kinase, partial [Gemmatimonadota bacterium]